MTIVSCNVLCRQSTLVTDTNRRDMINADRKGQYRTRPDQTRPDQTRRSGDGSAFGAAIHTVSGARLVFTPIWVPTNPAGEPSRVHVLCSPHGDQ